MKTDNSKNMAVTDTTTRAGGVGVQKYYTADEAIMFIEPRIRAMFC